MHARWAPKPYSLLQQWLSQKAAQLRLGPPCIYLHHNCSSHAPKRSLSWPHHRSGTVLRRLLWVFKLRGAQTSGSWWNRRSWSNGSLGLCTSKTQSCLHVTQHHWYSQTRTTYGNCRDGWTNSRFFATKHLCSPCSCCLARSCTRFSCMIPLPGKSAGRTLWSWRARSLCSRRRARENCTWHASGYSPTVAL